MNPSRPRDQYRSSQDGPSEWPHETPTQPRFRGSGEPPLSPRQPLSPPSSPMYTPRAPGSRPAYRASRHPYDPPNQIPGWPAAPSYGEPEQRTSRPASSVDISAFTIPDWLILGGGLLTLLGSFLPWLSVSGPQGVIDTLNGWYFALGKATLLVGLLALALFAARLFEIKLPFQIPWQDRTVYLALGIMGTLFVVLYVLDASVPRVHLLNVSTVPAFGAFLVLFATATIAVGGYMLGRMKPA